MKKHSVICVTKKVAACILAVSCVLAGGTREVFAADIRYVDFNLRYETPASNLTAKTCTLTYYGGTNYFDVTSISGDASAITVTCEGRDNIIVEKMTSTRVSSRPFTYSSIGTTLDRAKFFVSMTHSPGDSIAYAKGNIHYNR